MNGVQAGKALVDGQRNRNIITRSYMKEFGIKHRVERKVKNHWIISSPKHTIQYTHYLSAVITSGGKELSRPIIYIVDDLKPTASVSLIYRFIIGRTGVASSNYCLIDYRAAKIRKPGDAGAEDYIPCFNCRLKPLKKD